MSRRSNKEKERKSVCYFLVEERSLALDRVGVLEGGAGGVSEPPRCDLPGCPLEGPGCPYTVREHQELSLRSKRTV